MGAKIRNGSIKNLSRYVIYITLLVWLVNAFITHPWTRHKVINHDVVSYYSYLPAVFIYNDLSFEFRKSLPEDFEGRIWYNFAPNGNRVQKMTMGLSIMYLPFFFLGHLTALLSKYPANGYSSPYEMFIAFGAIVYSLIALFMLRRILLKYFQDRVVALVILIIALGTNHLHYVAEEGAMPHSYGFFLFVLFIHIMIRWHSKPSWKETLVLGLIGGLITLIRPTNCLIFLLPVLYKVNNSQSLKDKISLVKSNIPKILTIGVIAFGVFFIQMIYWRWITGDWLYYSYQEETFIFSQPQIINGLFSYRKGWLVYTPLMLLAIAGIPMLYKRLKNYAWAISIFLLANIYVIFSWWSWWYGGSFGARPLIESYAILALPLGCAIQWILGKKIYFQIAGLSIILLLVSLNIFQNYQYRKTIIHWDSMSKEAYWGVFLKSSKPDNFEKLLSPPESKK